ncbi:hypothetical protein B484DRAFT_467656, partial [Ochromonadaceae sp. CCMP2298]
MKAYLNLEVTCRVCRAVTKAPVLNKCLHVYCVPCRRAMETDCDHRCRVCGEQLCGQDEAYGRGLHCTLRMMALLESGAAESAQLTAELTGLNKLALSYFFRAIEQDQRLLTHGSTHDLDFSYYSGWQLDFKGDHFKAADWYQDAVKGNASDWRALGQLVKLYLKVGLPSAALHHCELYHAALTKRNDLSEEEMLTKLGEVSTLIAAANRNIATPRWRFEHGDRVLVLADRDLVRDDGVWTEGRITVIGLPMEEVDEIWPFWMGSVPYGVILAVECDCVLTCTCARVKSIPMDSDCVVRRISPEYRQALRRPAITGPVDVDMAAVERELLPLLAEQDRSWLESTGDVSATVSRLWLEYNRLLAPRKRLTRAARNGAVESPAVILSRLFPGQSDDELRSIGRNQSLDEEARVAAWMALGDSLLLGVGRAEDWDAAQELYQKTYELHSNVASAAMAIMFYLRHLPPSQQRTASLADPVSRNKSMVWFFLENSVNFSMQSHVYPFLLWQAKHALAVPDHDPPLSNILRSMVERAEDISPIEFPSRPQELQGQGQTSSCDYKVTIKRAQTLFAEGKFRMAYDSYIVACQTIPPNTGALASRLYCQALQCQLSEAERSTHIPYKCKHDVDDLVLKCERELRKRHHPPDVQAKTAAILTRGRELQLFLLVAAEVEGAAAEETEPVAEVSVAPGDFLDQHEQMMRSRSNVGVSASQRRQHRESERERVHAARRRHSLASAARAEAAAASTADYNFVEAAMMVESTSSISMLRKENLLSRPRWRQSMRCVQLCEMG